MRRRFVRSSYDADTYMEFLFADDGDGEWVMDDMVAWYSWDMGRTIDINELNQDRVDTMITEAWADLRAVLVDEAHEQGRY